MEYTAAELMVAAAARELADGEVVLVGIGIPNAAVNLARRLRCPNLTLIYESGAIGARPARLPVSIGDPALVLDSVGVCSMFEVFSYYLQGGFIDVGFLGGAQVDRLGNINSTVIGGYARPRVRLPGSGGACEIALLARKVLIVIRHSQRSLPAQVDFITSPGHAPEARRPSGRLGPQAIITDLGVLSFNPTAGEMVLRSVHPGVTVERVQAETGWDLQVADNLAETSPPTAEELRILREELRFSA